MKRVVTALPLKEPARQRLATQLNMHVVDVRDPGDEADFVLTPSCSPQLIACLKERYHGAEVVVVELSDWDYGISLDGPLKRVLRGGADAYLLCDSIDELAMKLGRRDLMPSTAPNVDGYSVDEIVEALLRESIEYGERLNPATSVTD